MFKSSLKVNGVKEESAGDFSFHFSSLTPFLLLPTYDGGHDAMDVSVNIILIFLSTFALSITIFCGIANTYELAVYSLDAHFFVFDSLFLSSMKQTETNI